MPSDIQIQKAVDNNIDFYDFLRKKRGNLKILYT